MNNGYLLVKKFSYLKTPRFTWIFINNSGGSFSNAGDHKSLKACLDHYLFYGGHSTKEYQDTGKRYLTLVKYVHVFISANGNDVEEKTIFEDIPLSIVREE